MAKLDWILAYEGARTGAFGDQSQAVMDRIKESAGKDFEEAVSKGYVKDVKTHTETSQNETGSFEKTILDDSGIDWSKLPSLPKAPDGTFLYNIGGRAGTEATGKELGFYNDPNYGLLGLAKQSSLTPFERMLPSLALALSGGAIAAGVTGAAGLTGFGKVAASTAIKGGLSTIFGQTPSPYGVGFSLLKPSLFDYLKGS